MKNLIVLERRNLIRYLFSAFYGFVLLDIFLFVFFIEYRDFFGVIKKDSVTNISVRLTPDILMFFFYTNVKLKIHKYGYISRKVVLVHSFACLLIGLALCTPWIGMFLAPLSPIGSLYLSSILLFENGYYISLGIALIFVILNIYVFVKTK